MELAGKELAKELEEKLKERISCLKTRLDFVPIFATILVGNDASSHTYVRMKGRMCERLGLQFSPYYLEESATTEDVLQLIEKLNKDDKVVGILLQHPMPWHVDELKCFDAIDVEKDVDGVSSMSFGKVASGQSAFECATPKGIMRLLEHYHIDLAGKHVVVVGRSNILGKPVALMMLKKDATVTICHSKTVNLVEHLRRADVVVAAVGKPKFIRAEWLKIGVVIVDAGYNPGNVGDVDLEEAKEVAAAFTPVPGGVGPMTLVMLFEQVADAIEILSLDNA